MNALTYHALSKSDFDVRSELAGLCGGVVNQREFAGCCGVAVFVH